MVAEVSTLLTAPSRRRGCSQDPAAAPPEEMEWGGRCPCLGLETTRSICRMRRLESPRWAATPPVPPPPGPPPAPADSGFPRCWGAGAADQRPVSFTSAGHHLWLGGQCAPGPVTSLCDVTFFKARPPFGAGRCCFCDRRAWKQDLIRLCTGAWPHRPRPRPVASESAAGGRALSLPVPASAVAALLTCPQVLTAEKHRDAWAPLSVRLSPAQGQGTTARPLWEPEEAVTWG